jgi:general secretion pathway protein B
MSFILDALRKSDAERQRTAAPGIVDVRYSSRQQRRSLLVPLLLAVLAANIGLMAYFWLRNPPPVTSTPPELAEAPAAMPAPPVTAYRPLSREIDAGTNEPEPWPTATAPAVSAGTTAMPATEGPQVAAPVTTMPPASGAAPETGDTARSTADMLPTADDLVSSGQLASPQLNLDLHVYGQDPAARFVVINSRRYAQGAQLVEGPVVDEISPDGVILNNRGTRFLLPRK